jgi:LacI family transcriptional regulator
MYNIHILKRFRYCFEWIVMAITISDIAKKAGVAVATVSMVLNRKSEKVGIARETREKVLDIARQMDYRPSFSARSLANGKTLSLGYLCGDIDTPYYSEVASKALHQADRKGYNLIISVTEWDFRKERRAMDMLLNGKVDGVLMAVRGLLPGTPEYETVVRK